MVTIKSFTDIKQAAQLSLFLPIESADMCYYRNDDTLKYKNLPLLIPYHKYNNKKYYLPCWSLAALLDVLNKTAYFINENGSVNLSSYKTITWNLRIDNSDLELITRDNPVDACYDKILKLHKLNWL